eukprot:TRINITY_DN8974_c0_g1_i1.p1 TRINITY_DN8974_c0_g1~~TRINITY_DN8974_c0_g1_i1.p1  ORF type:complete len:315 (+),score=38.45 TRINITY_DN8974_c0_g1_i1:49-945(+)
MFMPQMNRRGGGRGGLGLLMLFAQVQRLGLENIPGVTLSILAANVGLFLTDFTAFGTWKGCLSYDAVVLGGDYRRLLTYAFIHANDWHLAYNMSSFTWKGYNLERQLGTSRFLAMVILLVILTPVIHMGFVWALLETNMDRWGLWRECAVGFSGVLFGMKVMTTLHSDRMHDVFFGLFSVQGKYVVWAELVFIHFLHPGTSFMSHLSGILAGLLYAEGLLRPAATAIEAVTDKVVMGCVSVYRSYQQNLRNFQNQPFDDHRNDDRPPPPASHPVHPARDEHARREAAEAARRRWNASR